jgi:hypothetical protein
MLRVLPMLLLLSACAEDHAVHGYYLRTDRSCARAQPLQNVTPAYMHGLAVNKALASVEVVFATDTCSTAGGDYVLARDPSTQLFIGAAGCDTWTDAPTDQGFGVALYSSLSTATSVPADACVAFPNGHASDLTTTSLLEAVVTFKTRADADRFLNEAK